METLFAYGSLRKPHIQQKLIGRTIEGQSDELQGYRRDRTLLPPYPVAIPSDQDEHIHGVVLQVSEDELETMDTYEGFAYIRVRLFLRSGIEAWIYIGNPAIFRR